MRLILRIYDYFKTHAKLRRLSLALLTAGFAALLLNLRFSENISDFLPLGKTEQDALAVYQNISGASRLYILFHNPDDPDLTIEAMDSFAEKVEQKDSSNWCADLAVRVDMSQIQRVADFVYHNAPYFLDENDYVRMDSLMAVPGYVRQRLEGDRNALMFPTGGMAEMAVSNDPLGLFTPVVSSLQGSAPGMGFEMIDGYIFTPDMKYAVAMMSSPFGNSETEHNTQLLNILHSAADEVEAEFSGVSADIVGGPEIAVGNSSRIKKDSILAISLSVILIILLVAYSIGSLRNILLIFLSIGWGWLFAMAGISIFSGSVSIIVIGISSVILGIAVNYPLHLIAHTSHTPDMRQTLREIVSPLVIGNITTVGAFLALVPLKAAALRDLGIFASLLLVGTIAFVLLYLPHIVEIKPKRRHEAKLLNRIAAVSPEKSKAVVIASAAVTLVLAFFSVRTEFDSNISNINYMTERQRADMEYFQSLLSNSSDPDLSSVYVLSTGADFDEALSGAAAQMPVIDSLRNAGLVEGSRSVRPFLCSREEQSRRLALWSEFVERHREALTDGFSAAASACGFSPRAFGGFRSLVDNAEKLVPQEISYFSPLTDLVLSQSVTEIDGARPFIVETLSVKKDNLEEVKSHFDSSFDVRSMNSALSNTLSDNFNYIGWACSLIVFFFLWFSFGSLELALISFLPMAVSWVWILGIMALLGIKFNIVNIILATFIFGQGDDYTIFMTEGCQYEYAFRRPILSSYKSSILQSALIMFVGIGTLIVSKHPAMRSLAEVTITGMFSVVLMAYIIPPLFFRWMTTKGGKVRQHPLTLKTIFFGQPKDIAGKVRGRYIYKGKEILRTVSQNLKNVEDTIEDDVAGEYVLEDRGYGETALYLALAHPRLRIVCIIPDGERRRIASVAAEDFAENVVYLEKL